LSFARRVNSDPLYPFFSSVRIYLLLLPLKLNRKKEKEIQPSLAKRKMQLGWKFTICEKEGRKTQSKRMERMYNLMNL